MPKPYRIALFIFIQIITLVASYFIGKRAFYYESGLSANRADALAPKEGFAVYRVNLKELNANQTKLFKLLPHDTSDIVFVGTSLTQGFPLQEMFDNIHLKNRGIGGNKIKDIRARIDEVVNGHPKKIFLEAGTNDIGATTVDSAFNQFTELVKYIMLKTPKTKLYANAVLPFGRGNLQNIKAYNTLVAGFCNDHKITFINLYPLFVGGNCLKAALTTDGTHLTAAGYFTWRDNIQPYINN